MLSTSIDKKKRNTSGSRSKSRKAKPNDFSVELKPHKVSQAMGLYEHTSKVKTQNSLNKSKGSRKHSRHSKKSKIMKQSKDISHSVSAERRHTLSKINRTEGNFDTDQTLQKRLQSIQKNFMKIRKPQQPIIKDIKNYYSIIQSEIQTLSEPLCSFLCFIHELYSTPVRPIIDLIAPYEDLLKRKEELSRSVEEQVKYNEQIYSELDHENIQILKLKEKIQLQRQEIEEKKKIKQKKKKEALWENQNISKNLMKKQKDKSLEIQIQSPISITHEKEEEPKNSNSFGGLKLNLGAVNREQAVGFHDEFYSKLDEFSESWRNQALRQKRY